jgi:hypothetical protein
MRKKKQKCGYSDESLESTPSRIVEALYSYFLINPGIVLFYKQKSERESDETVSE